VTDAIAPTKERLRQLGERIERPGLTRSGHRSRRLESHRIPSLFERMNLEPEERAAAAMFERDFTSTQRVAGLGSSYGLSPVAGGFESKTIPDWILDARTRHRRACEYMASDQLVRALELACGTDITWPDLGRTLANDPTMGTNKAVGYGMGVMKLALERLARFYDAKR
jgi:hypothetical protein